MFLKKFLVYYGQSCQICDFVLKIIARKMTGETNDDEEIACTGSPILEDFRIYAAELTARHDRHERIVRLSRDVTTESKRIIFYLHSLKSNNIKSDLLSAEKRLKALCDGPLKKAAADLQIGKSLKVPVPRSLTPGIEELSEAFCFFQFLKTDSTTEIPSWGKLQDIVEENIESKPAVTIHPLDFMLGVLDFTGELMRMCINNSSMPNNEICFSIKTLMQNLYIGFIGLRYHKDIHSKMTTFKQSLQKVEDTCYNLKLRNNEI